MIKFPTLSIAILLTLILLIPGFSPASPIDAETLARKVHDRTTGDDITTRATMKLLNSTGHIRLREFTLIGREDGTTRCQLIRFTSPAEIAGTGFLSLEKENGETEQFLYLPALGRSRRIVSSQKSRSFVNSDFTYEDMQRRPVDEWAYQLSGSETIGGKTCQVLESRPKPDTNTAYSLIRAWIDPNTFMPMQVYFFAKNGRHIKTYKVLANKTIQGIPTEMKVEMHNLVKNHRTILENLSVKYNQGIKASAFTTRQLEDW